LAALLAFGVSAAFANSFGPPGAAGNLTTTQVGSTLTVDFNITGSYFGGIGTGGGYDTFVSFIGGPSDSWEWTVGPSDYNPLNANDVYLAYYSVAWDDPSARACTIFS
jgi:hypothetical protein